jgi:SAM-dependent methyltransferase
MDLYDLNNTMIYKKLIPPYGMRLLKKYLKDFKKPIRILDIGCGNRSVKNFKLLYGNKIYYVGIDKEKYNITEESINLMDEFRLIDLEKDGLSKLLGQKFDVIYFSHVIEHITNGYDIIKSFKDLQNNGGLVYIETPSEKSVYFPKAKYSTLNFFDDPTHKQIYPLNNIINTLNEIGYEPIKYGIRKDYRMILISPLGIAFYSIMGKEIPGGLLYDILGFANFVLAKAL